MSILPVPKIIISFCIDLFSHAFLPVSQQATFLCATLSATENSTLDMAPELTRAVTNVVCSLCFNSSYQRGDPEFESMLQYSQGIVDTVAKQSMLDIFSWLQVRDLKNVRNKIHFSLKPKFQR